jgi:hypothetical protein
MKADTAAQTTHRQARQLNPVVVKVVVRLQSRSRLPAQSSLLESSSESSAQLSDRSSASMFASYCSRQCRANACDRDGRATTRARAAHEDSSQEKVGHLAYCAAIRVFHTFTSDTRIINTLFSDTRIPQTSVTAGSPPGNSLSNNGYPACDSAVSPAIQAN